MLRAQSSWVTPGYTLIIISPFYDSRETIFGYENLDIKLYFAAGSLKPYIGIDYSGKVNTKMCDGVGVRDIMLKLIALNRI